MVHRPEVYAGIVSRELAFHSCEGVPVVKKSTLASLVALVVILMMVAPSQARGHGGHGGAGFHGHHHSRVFVGVGSGFVWDPWWPYPPYAYAPPVVVQEPPPVYIEREPASPVAGQAYWYYCPSAKGYYPSVPTCGEPWVAVPPRAP
jgi:hypothetical protein